MAAKKTVSTVSVPTTPLPKIELGYGPHQASGRPRSIRDINTINSIGQAYINSRLQAKQAVLITGLAIALGCCNDTLNAYRRGEYDVPEQGILYSAVVKKLVMQVVADWEDRMSTRFPTGAIFWLKNHGWTDQMVLSGVDSGPIEVKFVRSKGK